MIALLFGGPMAGETYRIPDDWTYFRVPIPVPIEAYWNTKGPIFVQDYYIADYVRFRDTNFFDYNGEVPLSRFSRKPPQEHPLTLPKDSLP